MNTSVRLAEMIRERLREIDGERDHLLALLDQYTAAPVAQVARDENPNSNGEVRKLSPFQARPGGLTERVLLVVRTTPGLVYGEIIRRALDGLQSTAKNPKTSLSSTLSNLVQAGKIDRRDGKYYAVEVQ